MNDRIQMLLDRYVVNREQENFRQDIKDPYLLARKYQKENLDDLERSTRRLVDALAMEKPVVMKDEKIALLRTVPVNFEIFTKEEQDQIRSTHYIHEQGKVCNINPRYSLLLNTGFVDMKNEIIQLRKKYEQDKEKTAELDAYGRVLDAVQNLADRYREEAVRQGNGETARVFAQIPAHKPESFLEALQELRLLHYALWCSFNYHNTFGRFDQYMYPFYKADIDSGRLNQEEALELVEEFFISCNKDSDLYPGMQQGDNGQSMVLGGLNPDGTESWNDLSDLCLQASLELRLIDPKINVRVNKNTPLSLYEKGTELTKQGIGFPQYSNDDVVIKGLQHWGYEKEDAYNYVVAACWEFIIPGCGMDIPNLNGLSFPAAITHTLGTLPECDTFEDYLDNVHDEVFRMANELCDGIRNLYLEPAPFMSLMMDGCLEKAEDISKGNKYNNFGFHGTGLSTAVDSLAAIRKYVYQDKMFGKEEFVSMVRNNFQGHESDQNMLRYEGPKMGNDDDEVDELAVKLLDWFADALEGKKNERGGIFRAGTGSAMYYAWQSINESATPDGRSKGEEFACNYSPSLFSRLNGPVSIIKSFSKPHLYRVANGGPLTIELHDTLFRNKDSVRKVAMFVKAFIDMGGHQMQINSVNREILLDAKAHPDKHRNLIVRVWGWSGYFVELDEMYQNQIIKRMELTM
jgi:pyruvate-formate lyase